MRVFYEIDWNHHLPRIAIVDDRETIDALKGERTERWVIGWSEGRTVYLLNRDNLETESNHKYTADDYSALLKHELSHSFYKVLSQGHHKPIWLNEGIAIYVSGQNRIKKRPSAFSKFLEYYENGGDGIYSEAGFFVEGLIEKAGKQKLLRIIRSLRGIETKEEFEQLFANEYGFSLNYDEINTQELI
ncbi:MAG: hypothetical protein JRN15_24520 [Nitrososphaerota archaeon]|nr:hypothetical protein [Nitrososphaerota archaeon]